MKRIGAILRNVLRWLGGRLPRRIGVLLTPQEPPAPPPRTMAESREQALAAWEHLVSQHAPHLLQESTRERRGQAPFHWPRMEPFASTQRRAWPAYPAGNYAAPLHQEERQRTRAPASNTARARPDDIQPPDNNARATPPSNGHPDSVPRPDASARADYHPSPEPATAPGHQGWQQPVTPKPNSVRARPGEWTTPSTGNRTRSPEVATPSHGFRSESPEAAVPSSGPRSHEPMSAPIAEPQVPQPPTASGKGISGEATESSDDRHRGSSPWLETPIPETKRPAFEPAAPEPAAAHADGDPWPDLPGDPWPSLPTGPRPGWTEADRRQRLLDEQRGVL